MKRLLCAAGLGLAAPLASASAFLDQFDTLDGAFWYVADGWHNGPPFNVGWRADHAQAGGGQLVLGIDATSCPAGCSGLPYASANVASNAVYGYGSVRGRLQAAAGAGLVTSLFTYVGPDSGHAHDEIDIEILGQDTTRVQFNFFAAGSTGNEYVVDLGFDASAAMHDYAFAWSPTGIAWYVDGVLRHTVSAASVTLPSIPGQVMVNLWAVDGSATAWAGTYDGTPALARYDYVGFTPLAAVRETGVLALLVLGLPLVLGCSLRGRGQNGRAG
ncbi:MAG: family 16 glycosylhydrolase [Rhodocyclaceae bacterium]|nr:family 16 glycosylhydrolase [Rhodocyclaceae bacterium]